MYIGFIFYYNMYYILKHVLRLLLYKSNGKCLNDTTSFVTSFFQKYCTRIEKFSADPILELFYYYIY